jgi:hypothetical protein
MSDGVAEVQPTTVDAGSDYQVVVTVRLGGEEFEVTFLSTTPLTASGDLNLAISLIPAMVYGDPLRLSAPVSPRLLSNIPRLQELLCHADRHNPQHHRRYGYGMIPVEGETAVRPSRDRGVACFFTGGVDSLYSTLKHRDEISALVFVTEGFDVSVFAAPELRSEVLDRVRNAAATLGLPLVELWTDLRLFSQQFVLWGDYNGSALAAVALLLRDSFAKVYIPATLTYSHLLPQGTSPVTDPLWSTDDLEIVHDGIEANRLEKLEAIAAQEPALLSDLRVCMENTDGAYNCGRCEKCVRTMTALRLAGLTDVCRTFPVMDRAALDDIVPAYKQRSIWEQMRSAAEERDPELARALAEFVLKPSR